MIKLSIYVKTCPDKKKEFLRTLHGFRLLSGLIENLNTDKSCIGYHLKKDKDQKDCFHIEAEWRSWEDFEAHIQNKPFAVLLGAIHVLCISRELKVTDGYLTKGVEAIEAAKQAM